MGRPVSFKELCFHSGAEGRCWLKSGHVGLRQTAGGDSVSTE